MDHLRKLNTPEINKLSGYLEALSNLILGPDYITWFTVLGFDLVGIPLDQANVIETAYPDARPKKAHIEERRIAEMVECINKAIRLPGTVNYDNHWRLEIDENLIRGFWKRVKACVDYEHAKIFEYVPTDREDELWDFVHWGFTFLVYDQIKEHCLILKGGASD